MKQKISVSIKNIIKNEIIKINENENVVEIFFDNSFPISSLIFKNLELALKNDLNIFANIMAVAQEQFNWNGETIFVQKIELIHFESEQALQQHLLVQEELKKFDHRELGKKIKLFEILNISPGSVFWLKKGVLLYNKLQEFIRSSSYDIFDEVKTPFIMSNKLWKTSGHLEVFSKNMFFLDLNEKEKQDGFALKPMNCPGHVELFKKELRSYKDLPIRIAEFGCCHRYEPSGALFGLMRVRSFTIDDGHIFCTKTHIKQEVSYFVLNALKIYKKFTFNKIKIFISTKPENALGLQEDWNYAEQVLQEALQEIGVEYTLLAGEGAFYGPKIEIHVEDSMKREWQLGTIQVDFVLPERFDLSFVNKNGEFERPCMLHRAIFGSIERFIGLLLEHTKGNLPLFIHPIPVAICSVGEECAQYCTNFSAMLKNEGINFYLDITDENLSNKVKKYKTEKTPILIIIGKKEVENNIFTIEYNGKKMQYKIEEIKELKKIINEN